MYRHVINWPVCLVFLSDDELDLGFSHIIVVSCKRLLYNKKIFLTYFKSFKYCLRVFKTSFRTRLNGKNPR